MKRGKTMERILEDEIKGLEAEIDSAIDRLFVDKDGNMAENFCEASSPRRPEPPDDQEFSFPPIPELSDEPGVSFSRDSEPSREKGSSLSCDSGLSHESAFFLSSPSEPSPSHEKEDFYSGLTGPSPEPEALFSYPSEPSHEKEVSFSPDSEPLQEKEFFFSDPSEPSAEKKAPSPCHSEPSYEMEITFSSSSEPSPLVESIDKMESQLLSLEWEITKENLRKTREEVAALRESSKENPDVSYVLGLMEKVLDRMIRREGDIRPPMIKFLLDAKETVKLLLREEASSAINTYKQLAYTGIETRFSCLSNGEESEESSGTEEPMIWSRMEGLFSRIGILEDKMEGLLKDWETHLNHFGGQRAKAKGRPVHVIVFKVDKRLLGVESDKVFKLFKVPNRLDKRYLNQQKVRLKDFETRIIDLRKILSIEEKGEDQEVRILMVRDNGEYKGLMVDQVIKNLSGCEETHPEQGEYFSGAIHWTYQDHAVDIPILDLNKVLKS